MTTFTVFIKSLTGHVIEANVSPTDTVKTLKDKIFDKTGLQPGKQLHDEQRLSECGLTKECIISLVKRDAAPAHAAAPAVPAVGAAAAPKSAEPTKVTAAASTKPAASAVAPKPVEPKAPAPASQAGAAAATAAPVPTTASRSSQDKAPTTASRNSQDDKKKHAPAPQKAVEATAPVHAPPATTASRKSQDAQFKAVEEPVPRAREVVAVPVGQRKPDPIAVAPTATATLPTKQVVSPRSVPGAKPANDEQRQLLIRLVKLCAEFNEDFDFSKYRTIKAIRQALIEQKVLERHDYE